MHVMFVCTANICRSAYATARAAQLAAGTDLVFGGCGTHALVGHPVEAEMAARLGARGADGEGLRSRQATPALLKGADLVLTMTRQHRSWVTDEAPSLMSRTWTLRQAAAMTEQVSADLPLDDRLRTAWRSRALAGRDIDIADPYRRGPRAAETCAQQIDQCLEALIPWLSA